MYRKEVNERSPLRILERSIHGGLGAGNLGVVMARAGVGKTAFLVQLGLDDALRERRVMHVALGQTLDHVHAWYDALFDDLAHWSELEEREATRALVKENSIIQAFGDSILDGPRLERFVKLYRDAIGFEPRAILIDGFDWEAECDHIAQSVSGFKAVAKECNAELWMSAQTHRDAIDAHPTAITAPCDPAQNQIDVAVFLEPQGAHVTVRLLKDHEDAVPPDALLLLDPDTMRLVQEGEVAPRVSLPPASYTLLSGGARGAEATFGEAAEKYGLNEITFSFAGRNPERSRGLVELSQAELNQGDVSGAYVESHLSRKLDDDLRKIVQSLWHQVSTAGEVFVVGRIQKDGTVRGGTGWGAELARHFKKPLYVFDQEQERWTTWDGSSWVECNAPQIRRTRFCGTGSQNLTDAGRAAIEKLFTDSFGDS